MEIIIPNIFKEMPELNAAISTKLLDEEETFATKDSKDAEKINVKFLSRLNLTEKQLAIPKQSHSNNVVNVNTPGKYSECDALITDRKRLALAVSVADCVPILLYDPIKKVIGAVHAGWKGTASKIVKRTIEKMKIEFNASPENLFVFIGPSAGACCYEVGEGVAVMFDNKNVYLHGKKMFVDLKGENKLQLEESGVVSEKIEVSSQCTICEERLFHSYRRDGKKAGRMKAIIYLT